MSTQGVDGLSGPTVHMQGLGTRNLPSALGAGNPFYHAAGGRDVCHGTQQLAQPQHQCHENSPRYPRSAASRGGIWLDDHKAMYQQCMTAARNLLGALSPAGVALQRWAAGAHFVSTACTTSLTGRLMQWCSTADAAEFALFRAEAAHGYRNPRDLRHQKKGRPPRRWENVLEEGPTREWWASPYMSWPRQVADAIATRWRVV